MWDDEVHIYNIIAQYERYMQYYIYDYTNIVYWHHTIAKLGLLCLHSMITCWVSFISGRKENTERIVLNSSEIALRIQCLKQMTLHVLSICLAELSAVVSRVLCAVLTDAC